MSYSTTLFLRKVMATLLITIFAFSAFSCKSKSRSGGTGSHSGGLELDIEGIDGPHVIVNDQFMSIEVTFDSVEILGGLRYPIPEYPNSYVEVGPALESQGGLMTVTISFDDLGATHLTSLDPQTLPGGRPLPGVRGGQLPAIAFSIEELDNIHFYAGNNFFGIFFPMPGLDVQQAILTARFYLENGSRAGNISLVGQDADGENGGVLLLLNLNASVFETSNVQHLFTNLLNEEETVWEVECNPADDNGDCTSNDV